jgi:hypothetical protein
MAAYKPLPAYHNLRTSPSPHAGKFEPLRPPSSNISLTRLVISACSSSIANSMRRSNPWVPVIRTLTPPSKTVGGNPGFWYLRYPFSYEHITELLAERGVAVTSPDSGEVASLLRTSRRDYFRVRDSEVSSDAPGSSF